MTQIGQLGISQDTEVIFYAAGVLPAATRAWWILRYAGHNNVCVLNGGLAATVNAMAHPIAGHENISMYDGSLMEWMGEGLPLAESRSA